MCSLCPSHAYAEHQPAFVRGAERRGEEVGGGERKRGREVEKRRRGGDEKRGRERRGEEEKQVKERRGEERRGGAGSEMQGIKL